MILDLEPIFNNEGLTSEFDYELDFSGEELSGAKPFSTPVRVRGSVGNKAGIVELNADASFVLDTFCDRCAKPLKYPVSVDIDHTLVNSLNDEDNDDLILIEDYQFNLDSLVSDDIFLDMPSKFLCKEDCKGLCPECGSDLNDGPCGCRKAVDPRLEVLMQLLDD